MSDLHPSLLRQLSLAGVDPRHPPTAVEWERLLSLLSSECARASHTRRPAKDLEAEAARTCGARAIEARDAFVAAMSHELRTPLNAIIGYSDLALHALADTGPVAEDVQRIRSAGHHLLALINGVLDLTRIEAGQVELFIEETHVPGLLEDCVDMIAGQAAAHRNRLVIDIDPSLGRLELDAMRVQHCVLHVLSNAVKFTREGEVHLRAFPTAEDGLCIEVEDTGIGMEPAQVAQIFAAFGHGSAEISREYGGMGLGLTLTHRLLHLMDGRVEVASTPGRGSTFRLLIPPQGDRGRDSASLTLIPETADSQGLILVIDDDPAIRQLYRRHLEHGGYETVLCGRPDQAVALARALSPRAITLDVMMPEIDGWQILSALRAHPETRDIPVVMVTLVEDRARGLALGASEYLTKPVCRTSLLEVLDNLGERHEEYVLIVDDDESLQQLAAHLVRARGLLPVTVSNGREALDWLADCPSLPRLIMLDLIMPEMDGFSLLQVLDHHREWSTIPTLVLTAKELTVRERSDLESGATRVLAKHASRAKDLMAELEVALSSGPPRRGPASA